MRLPVTVSDDGHRMTAALDVVRGMQHAAPEGLNAQHIEIISADCVTPQTSILSAAAAHVHGVEEVHRQATEHRVAVPIVFVVGIGNHRAPAGGGVVVEEDEFVLILDSEGPEDDGVHHGEDGGIRADAQSQRHNRGGSKSRAGAEPAERKGKIVAQHLCSSGTFVAAKKL